jgi:hypothetical protein
VHVKAGPISEERQVSNIKESTCQWLRTISRRTRAVKIFTPDKLQLRENVSRLGDRELAIEFANRDSTQTQRVPPPTRKLKSRKPLVATVPPNYILRSTNLRSGSKFKAMKNIWWLTLFLLGMVPLAMHGQEPDLQQSALDGIPILPSKTDPEIQTFDTPHFIYLNRDIVISKKSRLPADRHQLLLFIPGTQPAGHGGGKGPYKFLEEAANLGYHVIKLTYPNDVAAAEACNAALIKPARASGGFDAFAHISFGLHGQNQAMFYSFHMSRLNRYCCIVLSLMVVVCGV